MIVLSHGQKIGEIDDQLKLTTHDAALEKAFKRITTEPIVRLSPGKVMTAQISSTQEEVIPLTADSLAGELTRWGFSVQR
jgi:hypothetical protein